MDFNIHEGKQQINLAAQTANQYYNCVFTSGAPRFQENTLQPLPPAGTVVLLGADAEAAGGMPTSRDLIPRIVDWLHTEEGVAIDTALRKALPRLTFRYEKFVDLAIERLTRGLDSQRDRICRGINREMEENPSLTERQRGMGTLITRLLGKINCVKDIATIDEETERLISDLLGIKPTEESILDFSKTTYTRYFQDVISGILHQSLRDSEDPVLRHVYTRTLDMENLLVRYFNGFYTGDKGHVKSYMYIAWTMWAYLTRCQQDRGRKTMAECLSPQLFGQLGNGKGLQVINLNYTALPTSLERAPIHLMGTLSDYVDVETKNDLHFGDLQNLDLVDFFENLLSAQVSLSGDRVSLPIPSFMPPMKLMTLVSGRYIPTWHQASQAITQANRLLLLGLRLDPVKGYFNDLLRLNPTAEIIAVTPDMPATCQTLCRILQLSPNVYTPMRIQGHEARVYNNRVTIISASLDDIDLGEWVK